MSFIYKQCLVVEIIHFFLSQAGFFLVSPHYSGTLFPTDFISVSHFKSLLEAYCPSAMLSERHMQVLFFR